MLRAAVLQVVHHPLVRGRWGYRGLLWKMLSLGMWLCTKGCTPKNYPMELGEALQGSTERGPFVLL